MRTFRFWRWRRADDDDLDRELAAHFETAIEDQLENGVSLRDAQFAAHRQFGSVALTKEELREMHRGAWLHARWQDVRYACRTMRRTPGFAAVVVMTLALGIGTNAAMFALVDATLLRPLPFADPGRLVMVWERLGAFERAGVAPLNFRDWHERNRSFQMMAAAVPFPRRLANRDGTVEQIPGQQVTVRFFDTLGVRAILGRTFVASDVAMPPNIVVVGEGLWRTRFGSDPTLVGRIIRLDGYPFRVVGIVPADFEILSPSSVWTVWSDLPGMDGRALHFFRVIARLRPDVTLDAAQADMTAIAAALRQEFPASNTDRGARVESLRDGLVGDDVRLTSVLFLGVVAFVLLICCTNVANLLLARMGGRARELAIRSALGAGRGRIVAQIVTESLVLATVGGLIGVGVGAVILKIAPTAMPSGLLPTAVKLVFDRRVAGFCALTTLVVGLFFGLAPAWQATRASLLHVIVSESRSATTSGGLLRRLLTVAEVAMAVLLLTGAGLLLRTLRVLDGVDPGYRANRVLTMHVELEYGLPTSRFPNEEALRRFFDAIQQAVEQVPGVHSAGWGSALPFEGGAFGTFPFEIVGDERGSSNDRPLAEYHIVSPTFLPTLEIPIVAGRGFADSDTAQSVPVCLVSQAFARRYLRGRAPLGLHVAVPPMLLAPGRPIVREIVGVVGQVKRRPDEPEDSVDICVPLRQNTWSYATLVVRPIAGSAEALAPAVRAAMARVDKGVPVEASTLTDLTWRATARPRFRAVMVGTFAGLALLLAMVGVFGVLAYTVQQRLREFAVRIAIGASPANVIALVVRSAAGLLAAGIAIGLALAAALGHVVASMLFGVQPLDPLTFMGVTIVLVVTALVASAIPAYRAIRANPVMALRSE